MTKTKVSILMNCFNGEPFLERALLSVVNQTYQDWELIFYNNASTDNSKKIFLSHSDKRFKYYECEIKKNLVEARNSAIQFVTGEWIAILDCDDSWDVKKLETQMNKISFEASLSPGLIFSYCNIHKDDRIHEIPKKFLDHGNIFESLLSLDLSIPWSSVLIKREIFNEIKEFNELYPSFHDLDFIIQCSKITNFCCVNEALVTIGYHQNSLSSQKKNNGQYFLEIIKVLEPYSKNNNYALIGICKMKARYLFVLLKEYNFKTFFLELISISIKEYFYMFRIIINTVFQTKT